MEIKKICIQLMGFVKKYRYVILILVSGLVLMLMPDFKFSKPETNVIKQSTDESVPLSKELEEILSCVEGAGAVKVMVTTAHGEEIYYQTDMNIASSDKEQTEKSDTVLITGSDKAQSGLISRIDPPGYLGVIVLCQGADSASVRLAIMDAVAKVTGLGTDSISVLKMK